MMKEFTKLQDDDVPYAIFCLQIKTKLEMLYASAVVLAIFFLEGGVFFHLINAQRKPCLVLKLA